MNVLYLAAICTALVGCATDMRYRRIPNVLTLSSAVLALCVRATSGTPDVLQGVAGLALGLVIFLPLFMLRGLGGGDVKLLAALGAWLGPTLVVYTALFTAVLGGVFALVLAVWFGALRRTFANVGLLLSHWRVAGMEPVAGLTLEDARSIRLPYALPIAGGLVVALWLKG